MAFRAWCALRAALVSGLVLGARSAPVCADGVAWPNVDPRLGPLVPAAVTAAASRLSDGTCRLLFVDFADGRTGHPLAETLAATGESPAGYLRWITFTSGVGLRRCNDPKVLATTTPGSRVVFVCRDQFLRAVRSDEAYAANTLIHESLHSLGLGENPPSPREITERVEIRCGR